MKRLLIAVCVIMFLATVCYSNNISNGACLLPFKTGADDAEDVPPDFPEDPDELPVNEHVLLLFAAGFLFMSYKVFKQGGLEDVPGETRGNQSGV